MVISPFAKVNYVDHAVTDQSSILRFIEDNWSLGRIGDNSMDAMAGSLMGMFRFQNPATRAVLLDPSTGQPQAAGSATKAVANPKSLITGWIEVQLDGTQSTASQGGPLTYQWSVFPIGKQAMIMGGNTATPFVILNSGPGLYTFVLTVTDSTGAQSSDNATVILQ
jgi:phospholipase C